MPDEADAPPVISPAQSRFIANVSLPQKFDTKGNLAANWKKWVQIWKAYEIVTGLDKQPSTLRVSIQMRWKYTLGCRSHRRLRGKTWLKSSSCGRPTALEERMRFMKDTNSIIVHNKQMSRLMHTQKRFAHLPKPANLVC